MDAAEVAPLLAVVDGLSLVSLDPGRDQIVVSNLGIDEDRDG